MKCGATTNKTKIEFKVSSFFDPLRIFTFGDPLLVVSITKETDFDSCLTQNVDLPLTKVVLKWNNGDRIFAVMFAISLY
jgi:hypothetical protein